MKNVNQIRQLLEAMVKISNTEPRSAADSVYGGLATKALTLLPCETCNIENLKLKPCPFCGGKAEELENYHMHIECFHCPPTREFVHSAVQCLRCGGVMMGTSEQWNKRKKPKMKKCKSLVEDSGKCKIKVPYRYNDYCDKDDCPKKGGK